MLITAKDRALDPRRRVNSEKYTLETGARRYPARSVVPGQYRERY